MRGNRCLSPKRGKIGGDIREGFVVHHVDGFDLSSLPWDIALDRLIHLDRMGVDRDGCADPRPLNGKLPIWSSAIAAVPLFPRRGFAQSAACRSFVAGPTTAIDELPLRARAH